MTDTATPPRTAATRWLPVVVLLIAFGVLLALVEGRWSPLHRFDVGLDDRVNRAIAAHHALVDLGKGVSTVGQPVVFETLAVLTGAWLAWRGRVRAALFVPVGVLGANLLSTLVKALVGRHRPTVPHVLTTPAGSSFPSGHTIASGAAAAVVVVLVARFVFRALAVVVAVLVAASRLALGAHYLSDVVGAWLLGVAWVLALALLLSPDRVSGSSRG